MEYNKELTIWQTYHKVEQIKEFNLREDEHFKLFNANDVSIEGAHINHLNRFYSEMVTMYWVWKNNVCSRIVGFCHYRRKFTHFIETEKGECVVFEVINFPQPLWMQYKSSHNYNDLYDIIDILNEMYGENNRYSQYLLNSNIFVPFCSFIMQYEDFENLANFLFSVLFEFDKRHSLGMNAENYWAKAVRDFRYDNQNYQARAMSFLAERLISAYLVCNMNVVSVCQLGTRLHY